jgi:nicotinamidase-related amidase
LIFASPTPTKENIMPIAKAEAGKALLNPTNHTLIMIDHQPQMAFATKSIDPVALRTTLLAAKAAKEFKVATILTTVAEKSFSGPIFEEIKNVFPDEHIIDRTTMNTWEDGRIAEVVNARRTASCWPACGLRCASSVRPSRRWNRASRSR